MPRKSQQSSSYTWRYYRGPELKLDKPQIQFRPILYPRALLVLESLLLLKHTHSSCTQKQSSLQHPVITCEPVSVSVYLCTSVCEREIQARDRCVCSHRHCVHARARVCDVFCARLCTNNSLCAGEILAVNLYKWTCEGFTVHPEHSPVSLHPFISVLLVSLC